MILPVFKLGALALKAICKPIGKRIKKEAGSNPKFRQSIINLAQANHRLSTKIQRQIYAQATDTKIRPLNEEKAVQAAADLLGEGFIFTVAGLGVTFEVQRSSRSEARKEAARKEELEVIKCRQDELERELENLKQALAPQTRQMAAISFRLPSGTGSRTIFA